MSSLPGNSLTNLLVSVEDLAAHPEWRVFDCRHDLKNTEYGRQAYARGHIPGALFIPMNDVPNRLKEIPTDKTVIVQCRSGNRSSTVTDYLRSQGMNNVHNMSGGLNEWAAAGLPVEK